MPTTVRTFHLVCRSTRSKAPFLSSAFFRTRFSRYYGEGGSIPAAKNVFYRVSGLPRGAKNDDVRQFIKNNKTPSEADPSPGVEVLPACVQGSRETTSIAIVKFLRDQEPLFLRELARNHLSEITLPYEVSGVPGSTNITFDRHFHGFTQLYPTRPGNPILAEYVSPTHFEF